MLRKNLLFSLPVSPSIRYWWNFGSLLGACLAAQIVTGLFLAIQFTPHADLAFGSVVYIVQDVNFGWLLQGLHARGASIFFICIYLHVFRGMYYKSYILGETWAIGVTILFTFMGVAFLGYVLPWGQISFWGATVITGLVSTVPYGEVLLH